MSAVAAVREHESSRGRYVSGCRCAGCREANRVYITAWRRRRGVRPFIPLRRPKVQEAHRVYEPERVQ